MRSDLQVFVEGSGPRVVLVHGSVMGADLAWGAQAPLAERWTLVKPNRRGYGGSPPAEGEDFERDAADIAALLEDGDHLVGWSYGGVISLLAAAQRPDAVRSLAVLDPPAFGVVRGDDAVEQALSEFDDMHRRYAGDPERWAGAFAAWVGGPGPLPDPFPPPLAQGARVAYNQRRPDDAVIPVEVLRAASFPRLVVSGDGQPALGRACETLATELDAERAHIRGVGHMIPLAGPQLNDVLETFWVKSAG